MYVDTNADVVNHTTVLIELKMAKKGFDSKLINAFLAGQQGIGMIYNIIQGR